MQRTINPSLPKVSAIRIIRHLRNPVGLLDKVARSGHPIVQVGVPRRAIFLVGEPELIGQIWAHSRSTYVRDGMMWDQLAKLQGQQGIGSEGSDWQLSRDLLQPMLNLTATDRMRPAVAIGIDRALDNLAQRATRTRPMLLVAEMKRIAHTVLGEAFFGTRLSPDAAYEVGEAIDSSLQAMLLRVTIPGLPAWIPVPGDKVHRAAVRKADDIVYPAVIAARAEPQGDDIISQLAHVMDDRLARNNVVGLITGGTETTALALAWTLIALERHPEVAARLRAEVDEVVGGPGRLVRLEDVHALTYTGMVVDEALRLYPPAWMLPRQVTAEATLGGVAVRPGDTVVASPYLTQRVDRFWPDPQRFDPDRWRPDAPRVPKWAYFPFGGGIHRCIGAHLFRVEALMALAAIFSRFRVTVRTPQGIRPRGAISLQPRDATYIEVIPRR